MKHNLDEFSSTLLLCTLSLSKYSCVSTALHTHNVFGDVAEAARKAAAATRDSIHLCFHASCALSKQTWHSGMQPCVIQNAFPVRQICKAKSLLLSPRTEFNHS